MGAVTAAEKMLAFAEQMTLDAQEREHLRSALKMCLPYAEKAKDNARDEKTFKAARSAYRMGCAALGIEHE